LFAGRKIGPKKLPPSGKRTRLKPAKVKMKKSLSRNIFNHHKFPSRRNEGEGQGKGVKRNEEKRNGRETFFRGVST
jgi:hypothetical protein